MPEKPPAINAPVIMFDGPDGVGKSKQLALAQAALEKQGYSVFATRIHGGAPISEAIRPISLDASLPRPSTTDLHLQLAMYYATGEEISRHRQAGEVCVVDRSPLSIIAYQVHGDGLDRSLGIEGAKEAMAIFQPDLIICYEATQEILKQRKLKDPKAGKDYFESKPPGYLGRVIAGYTEASSIFDVVRLDASGSLDEVHAETMRPINQLAWFQAE